MATQEQARRSPPLETAKATSAATTMVTGNKAGGGDAGKEEQGPEGAPALNNAVRSSSPSVALLPPVVSSGSGLVSSHIASPQFQRKPRSHLHRRARPGKWWRMKLPVLPPAPAKKKTRNRLAKKRGVMPCLLCKATESPQWRKWPTDPRVMLCNACGLRVRTPGLVLPELVYLCPPATATATVVSAELEHPVAPPEEIQPVPPVAVLPAQLYVHLPPPPRATTTVVAELEEPPAPQQEIQDSDSSPPDSPTLDDSTLDLDVYLLKRTSPRRREKSPPPPPTAAEFPPKKKCQHCGATSTVQWRMGPKGAGTLCNPCGVRYRKKRLVPEYRPKASPTFNQEVHSNVHRQVLKIRRKKKHPEPPAKYKPVRTSRKRRNKGKGQQQPPAQVSKKRKGSQEQNEQPAAQPAEVEVLLVRKKSKKQHVPPPPPSLLLPHTGNDDMVQQHLPPPPPPPAQLHAGYKMMQDLNLPPALPHAGDDMEIEQQQLLPPAPVLPHAGGNMEQQLLPDPFLFDGPAAPRIIIDDEPAAPRIIDDEPVIVIEPPAKPRIVIVIDDD